MLAVPNGSCFCLLNSQLTAIPWGLLINGDFLGLDGWTIWISHGSGWNDYAFVKGEPSLLVIYGMFYGEKWTPTEAILPSTHPLKRHDTWNLLVFFQVFSTDHRYSSRFHVEPNLSCQMFDVFIPAACRQISLLLGYRSCCCLQLLAEFHVFGGKFPMCGMLCWLVVWNMFFFHILGMS